MSNSNDRILRFHIADKVFHSLNAILWFALVITGAIVYLADCENATGEMLMSWHLGLGIVFTLNLVGYLLFAPEVKISRETVFATVYNYTHTVYHKKSFQTTTLPQKF